MVSKIKRGRRRKSSECIMTSSSGDTRSMMDELYHKEGWLELGHPLLNRVADSFLKAASVGALRAVSRDALFTACIGNGMDSDGKPRFSDLKGAGESNCESLEAMVKNTGKESLQWGLAAGMYSGVTYGLKEARGGHDWKNSLVAGAITGAAVALTSDDSSQGRLLQTAITGAAISTAAHLLTGIF